MEIEVDLRLWLPTFMHRDMFYIVAHIIDHTLYTLSSFFPILKRLKLIISKHMYGYFVIYLSMKTDISNLDPCLGFTLG